ncbi:hypothetical protein [Streptomyces bambusae]|uniref:Uncharacterized protein n=1 Tax=Streptomyces bambusae TaxID=1550616 RepID=A0ABS6Z2C0_9ACTN|nr:hypothetical protein [Streptomyces bambusae]MBW5481887.1 hypothetical protein [Streptomyces bambusae]
MRSSILVTSAAAALLSVAAAVTVATEPGIDWPAAPATRVSAVQNGGGDVIDWPTPPSAPTSPRGGEAGVIGRA